MKWKWNFKDKYRLICLAYTYIFFFASSFFQKFFLNNMQVPMHLHWSMNTRRLILMYNNTNEFPKDIENFITEIVSSLVVLYAQKN